MQVRDAASSFTSRIPSCPPTSSRIRTVSMRIGQSFTVLELDILSSMCAGMESGSGYHGRSRDWWQRKACSLTQFTHNPAGMRWSVEGCDGPSHSFYIRLVGADLSLCTTLSQPAVCANQRAGRAFEPSLLSRWPQLSRWLFCSWLLWKSW